MTETGNRFELEHRPQNSGELTMEATTRDDRVRRCWTGMRASWDELGEHFYWITEKQLWKLLADEEGRSFKTIDDWLANAIPDVGRSTAYAARKTFTDLRDIPAEQRRRIPPCNAKLLAEVPEKERTNPALVKAAISQTEQQFAQTIERESPNSHIEATRPVKLKPKASQRDTYDRAINVAKWLFETESREEAVEGIMANFLNGKCEMQGFRNLNNEEAYDKARGEKKKPKAKGAHA